MPSLAIWHPFTQHALHPAMTKIGHAKEALLYDEQDQSWIDAISSWWVITHGHCYPPIMEAIATQTRNLDQIIFAGFSHEPAEQLAEALRPLISPELTHIFFSDSGSVSVEVALKMALGYWHHLGERRSDIITLEHSYHGDTIGAMSVGARGLFNDPYARLLFNVQTIPFPEPSLEEASCRALEEACARKTTAAFLVEPLVLGAGGMKFYPPALLKRWYEICKRHGILFIADEVMTGWGRTGTIFAHEQANIVPDILCSSKGLTGGSLPLAITLCKKEIYDAHYAPDIRRMFFHSSSFTANPIACAAALANIRIWQEEPVQTRMDALCAMQEKAIAPFHEDERFENVRQMGTITAMDVKVKDPGYSSKISAHLYAYFQKQRILLRPLGNVIYVLPPYCLKQDQCDEIYKAISSSISDIGMSLAP